MVSLAKDAASTEIYTFVEAMEYDKAHLLAGGMLVFSFAVLLVVAWLNRKGRASATTGETPV